MRPNTWNILLINLKCAPTVNSFKLGIFPLKLGNFETENYSYI